MQETNTLAQETLKVIRVINQFYLPYRLFKQPELSRWQLPSPIAELTLLTAIRNWAATE